MVIKAIWMEMCSGSHGVVARFVEKESSVGAGDSAVAGFVLAYSRGMGMIECERLACAAGTAMAKTPGTELCPLEDVEKILRKVKITCF
jgi:6-phosphofructokinase 2